MDIKKFGEKIKKLRKKTGKSQKQIANEITSEYHIGITQQSLGRYENGERKPDIEILESLARYYNVSSDYLLGINPNPSIDPDVTNACNITGLNEDTVKHLNYISNSNDELLQVIDLLLLQNKEAQKNEAKELNLLDLLWEYLFAEYEIPSISYNDILNNAIKTDILDGEYTDVFIYRVKNNKHVRLCKADELKDILLSDIQFVLKNTNIQFINKKKE